MMPELIIGIDPSLRSTGVCHLYDDGTFDTEAIKTDKSEDFPNVVIWKRINVLFESARALNGNISVAIEDYPYGMKTSKTAYGIEIGAIIRLAATLHGIPITVVNQNTWKSNILLPGWRGLRKGTRTLDSRYLDHAEKSLGYRFHTTDESDAFCIAKYLEKERRKNGD